MRLLNKYFGIALIIWLCGLITSSLQSQNYYLEYQNLSKSFNTNSYSINKKSVDSLITLANIDTKYTDISNIAHGFSVIAYTSNINDAIYYGQLSVKYKKLLMLFDKNYISSLFRLGYFHYINSEIYTAIDYYKEIIQLNIDSRRTAQAHCEIGRCYYSINNYYKSIDFYKIGISQLEELKEYGLLSREYIGLSTVYRETGTEESYNSQLKIIKKVEDLEKYIELSLLDYLKINNAYATFFANKYTHDFEKAKYYSIKNLNLALKNNQNDFVCTSYLNLANIYNLQKKDSAHFFASKALEYCKDNTNTSIAFFHQSECYSHKINFLESLKIIQKGINILIDEKDKLYNYNLTLKELKRSDNKDHLLFMLYEKVKLLHKNNQTKLALQHVLVSDSLIHDIQSNSSYTNKLHWRTKAAEIYTKGAEISYLLNDDETAFHLSEKGKVLLLNEGILQNAEFTKLPDSIAQKELTLRKKSLEITTQEQIFEAELQYENYIDSISKIFPEYFKKLNFQNTITLEDAKKKLDSNTVAISYLWPNKEEDSSYVYALFINNKDTKLVRIEKADVLTKTINTYKNIISKPFKSQKDREDYILVAHKLYKILFPDNYKGVFDKKKLVLIPDGNLHNIPFEALITDIESKDYLIESNSINYEYSFSFSHYNSTLTRETSKDFIGYAPENFNTELKLNDLNNTSSELNAISKNINGDILTKKLATKSSFLEQSKDYKIIHLATHANATETPWIAFKDEKVSLNELYTYKNNAELTVLSACESSTGEIATGEGVMSLARGFFYSGSNAVLASLWNANDKSTSFLMEEFYKHLKKGKSKSEALRTAKLNYLKTHSLSETSPYYWSSFVLIGNPSSIDFTPNYNIVYYILIILLVLIFSLIYLKRKKI